MTSLRINKRAEESSFSLTQLIGVVIAVVVLLGVIFPLYDKSYAFFKTKPHQGTVISFNELADTIEAAKEGEDPLLVIYHIADGFKVVGFNNESNSVKDICYGNNDEEKPNQCGGKACLVLCEDSEDSCRKEPKEFRVFENISNIFSAKDLEFKEGGWVKNELYNFVLYGDCNVNPYTEYEVKEVYIKREGKDIIISSEKD